MSQPRIGRALLSAYDKTGIVEFAQTLVDEFETEILSTGGTARALREAGVPVTLVETVTGFPELLNGRVKTLHPHIHAGLLADRDNPTHMRQLAEQGIAPIDLVAVNLYPFEQTIAEPGTAFADAIEMIDIGGPCLLRAAAKNHAHVLVVTDERSQQLCLEFLRGRLEVDEQTLRRELAAVAFHLTEQYDGTICSYLTEAALGEDAGDEGGDEPAEAMPMFTEPGHGLLIMLEDGQPLRYGENPHQRAAYLAGAGAGGTQVSPDRVLGDTPLSFNNYADAQAALSLAMELTHAGRHLVEPAPQASPAVCAFIKHTNACGVGVGTSPKSAYERAYLGDPNAAMGGVLAVNVPVDKALATAVMDTYVRHGKQVGAGGFFVEVWLAPAFDDDAVEVIRTAKAWGERVRLLAVGDFGEEPDADELQCRQLTGGMLVQTADLLALNETDWLVATERQPSPEEWADLRLAWLVCKHTKSNAISICKAGQLLGSGAGQTSRVMSCRLATWLAQDNGHADRLAGAAAASDAFFPFRDGPDLLADAGVTAIIQPGGSKRDADTVAACNERGLAMVLTGTRHFKH